MRIFFFCFVSFNNKIAKNMFFLKGIVGAHEAYYSQHLDLKQPAMWIQSWKAL